MRLIENMIELLESLGYEVTKKGVLEHQEVVYQNPYTTTTSVRNPKIPYNKWILI